MFYSYSLSGPKHLHRLPRYSTLCHTSPLLPCKIEDCYLQITDVLVLYLSYKERTHEYLHLIQHVWSIHSTFHCKAKIERGRKDHPNDCKGMDKVPRFTINQNGISNCLHTNHSQIDPSLSLKPISSSGFQENSTLPDHRPYSYPV